MNQRDKDKIYERMDKVNELFISISEKLKHSNTIDMKELEQQASDAVKHCSYIWGVITMDMKYNTDDLQSKSISPAIKVWYDR